jgi:hypothetical protein
MANPEHLKILRQGVEIWNRWMSTRIKESRLESPDLSRADLSGMDLARINFFDSILTSANLSRTNLSGANILHAYFDSVNLSQANLNLARIVASKFNNTNASQANLTDAYINECGITGLSLNQAKLHGARVHNVTFIEADLREANLVGAVVSNTSFRRTAFDGATLGYTILADTELDQAKGLEDVKHIGPTTIGIDTLYKSRGKIPDKFLRDAGVSEEIITHILPSIRNGPAIQWRSCFISYSTKDEEFARRLHSRMREANMRVWFAPEDLKGGEKLHEQLFEAIQIYDRLLIVLSEHSIQSEWVMTEIRKAREVEKKEKRRKLFPIRLTDFETLRDWTCFDADTGKDLAVEVREYFIPDFSNWKVLADGHPAAFESAFGRLKKDLEAENSKKP